MRLTFTILLLLANLAFIFSQSIHPEIVGKKLLDKVVKHPGDFHSVHIVLADRVDFSVLEAELSSRRAKPEERSEIVLDALKIKAKQTQATLLSLLKSSPEVQAGSVRSYWIANVIFAKMKLEMIAELSRRTDVAWIGLNGKLELEKFEHAPPPSFVPNGKEPGLAVIHAPSLWAMGYTGYGQVAFTNDTGVDPSHPALASRYRGFHVPGEQAWFELDSLMTPSGNYTPFDCDVHGTHVTGTILGLDRLKNDTIGVAFNAQWIGAPTLKVCSGFDSSTEYLVAAFEWALDPDGNPSTTDDQPDVINNSWYDPSLDTLDCFSVYVPALEALEAANIVVVFSAGNAGPDPGTITEPHNINLHEVNSFTVGALNGNVATLPIASFSSRGPSHCGGDSSILIKPEVSAPGVAVRSCVPGGYDFLQGTSMAAPHVSGAVLLLKEAFPDLAAKELKYALYLSCTDLGDAGEDNIFGMGVIDVLAAFNYLLDQGHLPVSPYRSLDLMLVDLQSENFACENQIHASIIVENAGLDTVYTFEIVLEFEAANILHPWSGVLAPGERVSLSLPAFSATEGEGELTARVQNPNGATDERPLNNVFQRKIKVTNRSLFPAHQEGNLSVAACENAPALLRGEYSGDGSVQVKWFDVLTGGNPLGEGIVFVTPPLAQPDTFYAEATYLIHAGLEDRHSGASQLSDEKGIGLTFDVHESILLKSVRVYTGEAGLRQIVLMDSAGIILDQSIKNIPIIGETRVELNWEIPPGKAYQILLQAGKRLYINTSGADYPYENDFLDITGATDGQGGNGVWYFFYDWEIQFQEPCSRTPVPVDVMPGGTMPAAAFLTSSDSLDLQTPGGGLVSFTNLSAAATEWHWNFGDGATSSLENPSHTYDLPGTYVVSLTILDQGGCSGFALDTIEVTDTQVSGTRQPIPGGDFLEVFPNPVQDYLTVHLALERPKTIVLTLCDIAGKTFKTIDFQHVDDDKVKWETAGLATGIYFLSVEINGKRSVWKVIKI